MSLSAGLVSPALHPISGPLESGDLGPLASELGEPGQH